MSGCPASQASGSKGALVCRILLGVGGLAFFRCVTMVLMLNRFIFVFPLPRLVVALGLLRWAAGIGGIDCPYMNSV